MSSDACIVCNKSNSLFCNRCKSARYCSAVCQRADWRTHKLLCEAFSNFNTVSRPTKDHFRAILFPTDSKKPQVIWIHCEWRDDDDDDGTYQYAQVESFLGPDAFRRDSPIQYNPVLKRQLSDTICICHRDTFSIDGSKANNSIAAITATKPGQCYDWRGPFIAYGREGSELDPPACKDLDMKDFRHITDYFLSYDYKPPPATKKSTNTMVKGVKINCLGDRKMLNKPHFEAIDVSSTDPIFSKHDTSDIAQRIGLPIFTRRCPPDPKWAKNQDKQLFQGESPFNNQDATYLHLCCDPKAEFDRRTGTIGWGWASEQWQNSVGSTVVVRQDKKPLSPLHVEALCRYCYNDIRPLFAHSMGEYDLEEPMPKVAVLDMICRPTFVLSWHKLVEENRKQGKNTDAPFPYKRLMSSKYGLWLCV